MRNDFEKLIIASIEIGNKLSGVKYVSETNNLIYAEGLSKKIISHIISAKNLKAGYSLVANKNQYKGTVDFASVYILTEGSIETYLTLNYLYTSPQDTTKENSGFYAGTYWLLLTDLIHRLWKIKIWNFKKQRSQLSTVSKRTFKKHSCFIRLNPQRQGLALSGQWRLNNSSSNFALSAGFGGKFFDQQYKFLCGYAHSKRLSVMQIQQTKELEAQKMMAMSSTAVLIVVLAKHMYDYINLIPELKSRTDVTSAEYNLIITWREVGNNWENYFKENVRILMVNDPVADKLSIVRTR